jgi:ribosomal 50S subunit-recycling heat shock protein
LKVGDVVEIIRGEKRTVARVLEIPGSKQVSKQAAGSLIEILSSETVEDPLLP